jgi:eukaryotic-like serine/threonine-protein kinase
MNEVHQREKELFNDALELTSPEARAPYLEAACAGDTQLHRRVEALLEAAMAAESFLPNRTGVERPIQPALRPTEGPGSVIGRYKLLEGIGEGGWGVVYMAEQQQPVQRKVALKIIKLGMDTRQVIARFEAERQALALMEHPNIARVLDAGATDTGRPYFVMELVRGIPVTRFCDEACLAPRERLELFIQICRGVQHAHQKGIIHRDLKPSNVLVTVNDGAPVPKIIDFGVAKAAAQQSLTDKTLFTGFAQFIGTPAYMSPEQAAMTSVDIDTRSDIYSLGVLIYELLTGQTPFDAKALAAAGVEATCRTIREQEPVRPSSRLRTMTRGELSTTAQLRRSDPPRLIHLLRGDLDWIAMKCLEKDRNRRYETAHALAADIERYLKHQPILARSPSLLYLVRKFVSRERARLAVAFVIAALAGSIGFSALTYQRATRLAWARGEALPRLIELVKNGENRAAFDLAEQIKRLIPQDQTLGKVAELWPRICSEVSLITTPAGAGVWCREYAATNESWQYLGRSPLVKALPRCTYRWRFEKKGFAPHECVADNGAFQRGPPPVRLREQTADRGMVWINAGRNAMPTNGYTGFVSVPVPAFLMDRSEVTHKQFKEFVDQGGYQRTEFWEGLQFIKNGRELSWAEAMTEFQDSTGQPGPATWIGGTHPPGQGNHPVSGVSWFEAAAYANFAGKSLPTVHHWQLAACFGEAQVIVPFSNLGEHSAGRPVPSGTYPGTGHTGLCDMAGNVKEWCWNGNGDVTGHRCILGGSWNESTYVFAAPDARSPWNRSDENGFRCARYPTGEGEAPAALFGPFQLPPWPDFTRLAPFTDQEFQDFKDQIKYDRTPLNDEAPERMDDGSVLWRKEKVTFDAAYGRERVIAYLFLPRTGRPPYQTVIFFPGVDAVETPELTGLPYGYFTEYIIHSGRALLFPVYYGTYERPSDLGRVWNFTTVARRPMAYRDWTIRMAQDLSRSIDYLETRSNDIDSRRIAYAGISHGAILGPMMLATEDRIKTGIFALGGLVPIELPRSFDFALYAQRVKAPVLMVNGSEDALLPWQASQRPLFEFLRLSSPQTEYKPFPGGHGVLEGRFCELIRAEVLDWLDRFLGPVPNDR